ncbi:MAG: DUF3574 domain-containing protein [Gammaproteobacteria bacterium]
MTPVIALAAALSACASLPAPSCGIGERLAVQDTLYFGTVKPTGAILPDEWSDFLSISVTPRFPEGLSVWEASGQWRSADGKIIREPAHILNLVHPDDGANEKAILDIVDIYKSRFQQEAVLRIKSPACVSF